MPQALEQGGFGDGHLEVAEVIGCFAKRLGWLGCGWAVAGLRDRT